MEKNIERIKENFNKEKEQENDKKCCTAVFDKCDEKIQKKLSEEYLDEKIKSNYENRPIYNNEKYHKEENL
jgi:hypothetical protein